VQSSKLLLHSGWRLFWRIFAAGTSVRSGSRGYKGYRVSKGLVVIWLLQVLMSIWNPKERSQETAVRWMGHRSKKVSVDNVNTYGAGAAGISSGPARIPYVFQNSQCLQGRECGSSPTSGTA
jgi:hypothetical protein